MDKYIDHIDDNYEDEDSSLIYGENSESELQDKNISKEKREKLKQTKISKQGWSIHDVYDRLKNDILNLNPDYQRNTVWKNDKKTSFIESLFMGIVVPPIYVVEIEPDNPLETMHYEVVDGKQRISTINDFLNNKFKLTSSALEYYSDLYGGKRFKDIYQENGEEITAFLSQVLDVYVITANSPEFSKYDIFSRLNRGAEPLYIDELRRSIWNSELTRLIQMIIEEYKKDPDIEYEKIFSRVTINRYKDHGLFYAGVASYYNTSLYIDENTNYIHNYNSRPRDMINQFLEEYASLSKEEQKEKINKQEIRNIMDATLKIHKEYIVEESFPKVFIYSAIRLAVDYPKKFEENKQKILDNREIMFNEKASTTTSEVNRRIKLLKEIILGN